jgi:hypothetical protein
VGIETVRNRDFFPLTAMRPEFVGVVNAAVMAPVWWIPSSVGCAKGCYMAESDI